MRSLLTALILSNWRKLDFLRGLSGNHLFLFIVFMLGRSAVFLLALMTLILLAPMSADPLTRIPASRLKLWPLTPAMRAALRTASILLFPPAWIAIGLSLASRSTQVTSQMAAFGLGAFAAGFIVTRLPQTASIMRAIPLTPRLLSALAAKTLREFLRTLDIYITFSLVLVSALYIHFHPELDSEARFGITILAVIGLDTLAQTLFGFDAGAGLTRFRLLPIKGWQILLAKDAAWFGLLLLFLVPLNRLEGITAGFAALAVGHFPSVTLPTPLEKWRFASGGNMASGIIGIMLLFGTAGFVHRGSPWLIAPAIAAWAASLFVAGRIFDHRIA